MVKKRRKSGIDWKLCAACGGRFGKLSGFVICESCGFKPSFDSIPDHYHDGKIDKLPDSDSQARASKIIRSGRLSYKKEIK